MRNLPEVQERMTRGRYSNSNRLLFVLISGARAKFYSVGVRPHIRLSAMCSFAFFGNSRTSRTTILGAASWYSALCKHVNCWGTNERLFVEELRDVALSMREVCALWQFHASL